MASPVEWFWAMAGIDKDHFPAVAPHARLLSNCTRELDMPTFNVSHLLALVTMWVEHVFHEALRCFHRIGVSQA